MVIVILILIVVKNFFVLEIIFGFYRVIIWEDRVLGFNILNIIVRDNDGVRIFGK